MSSSTAAGFEEAAHHPDRGPNDSVTGVSLPRPTEGPESSPSYDVIDTPSVELAIGAPGIHPASPRSVNDDPRQRRSPISPSPVRQNPLELGRIERASGISDRRVSPNRAATTPQHVSSGTIPFHSAAHPNAGLHDSSEAPAIRFDVLVNHNVPAGTIDYLRQFVDHHTRQTRSLRTISDNLRLLRSDVDGTREHAVSLTARVDRTMADTSRYLLESEDQLASLSRAFDQPRSGMSPRTLRSMSPGAVAALEAADINVSNPVHISPRPHLSAASLDNDDLYEAPPTHDPVHDATARDDMGSGLRSITDRAESQSDANDSTSDRAHPPRRPNETEEQYLTRRQAETRLAERSRTAWSRAFPDGSSSGIAYTNTAPAIQAAPASDANHEFAGCPREPRSRPTPSISQSRAPRLDVRFHEPLDALHPAVSAGPMAPEFDSISRAPVDHLPRGSATDPYSGLYVRPQGLSAYRISQTPVAGGLWNSDQYHFVVLIDKVVKLVNHKVGDPFEAPHGLKVPKIPDPSKYSGSSSHEEFMDWLGEFLNWLRGNYICGPSCDPLRVNYLGLYLSGSASDWYLTEIDNPDRTFHPALKFVDCVALMHKRFVRTATANNAVILFNAVRYNSKDGVEGLYYQLDRAASKMIERPSDYAFRSRLFNCLPHWMQTVMLSRNITPEYHQMIDIRENARQIEENSMRKYEGLDERSTPSAGRSSAMAAKPPRASSTPKAAGPRTPSRPQPQDSKPSAGPRIPRPPKASGARDTSTMTCYSCGEVGHISTQPVCPNYEQNNARLHAQRELDEGVADAGEAPHDGAGVTEDYTPTWGGSQYASDSEDELDADHDDADERVARVARMHTMAEPRMYAMRVVQDEDDFDNELADNEEDKDEQDPASLGEDGPGTIIPVRQSLGLVRTLFDFRDYAPTRSRILDNTEDLLSGGLFEDEPEDSDPYADMPALQSASESESEGSSDSPIAHGSESDPMSEVDEDSSTDHSTCASTYEDYAVRDEIARRASTNTELRYMDDVLHVPGDRESYQDYDYPAQRVTRPSTYRLVQDLRPTMGGESNILPTTMVSDRGPQPRVVPGLVVHWRFVGRAPEEHLPYRDTVEFLTPTVWVDTQDRFLDFWNDGDLEEYNDLVSRVVYCMACAGECRPIVLQQLVRLPQHQDGALHRTTYLCTANSGSESPPPSDDSGVGELNSFHSTTLMAMRVVHSANVRRPLGNISGLISRPKQSHTTITCLIDINGHKALALFDSGSTTDSVTPEFAFVSKLKQFTLPEQVTLQLGCIGSRSKICYGTVAPVDIFGICTEMYFDLINIDRYDAILGTPFLEKHGVCLDFKRKAVVIDGIPHETFSIDDEIAYIAKRGGVEKKTRRAAPRETAPVQARPSATKAN